MAARAVEIGRELSHRVVSGTMLNVSGLIPAPGREEEEDMSSLSGVSGHSPISLGAWIRLYEFV